ncbi:Core-2/I-Branching enzyme [Evansella caseinilytica]|uniref:Peptide O-xylosyltransferase n=1 Tax=Evansella caseinilytica TaxID=1503961 RepID=A0A1H3ULM9_9BACI|nr:beta-1,6-N-acetylglucosaminyltransferase [Evansella caseinilytica]SDZ63330.1 Core-2/I-Branching enzyme [Evansella caseinilytica]
MSSATRTAFLLQVHKNPDQINAFIHQLISNGQADVFIHVDKQNAKELNDKITTGSRVKILEQNIDCIWGDISQVDTTLLLLREAVNAKNDYDYVCLRSGQDLLVRNGFKDFLAANNGRLFFRLKEVSHDNLGLMHINWPKITRKRYSAVHPIRIYRRLLQGFYRHGMNILPNKQYFPEDYQFYVGSQWFTIPLEAAQYIVDFIDDNPWYYRFFENTLCPDEWFFTTLMMNSEYKHQVINDNFMFLKWGVKFGERNSPTYLTNDDIQAIEASGHFFARKFDASVDSDVIDYFSRKVSLQSNEATVSGNQAVHGL